MARRRKLSMLAGTVGALAVAITAWAYFTAIGSGSGNASVADLASPSPVTASAGVGSAHVTWSSVSSPSGTVGAVTFTVDRSLNGGEYAAAGGTCAGTLPNAAPGSTLSCDDSIATAGSYVYRVTAHFRTWTSSGVSNPVTVVVDATPPTSTITFPAAGGSYNATTYRAGCTAGTDEICGTAVDPGAGASGLDKVQVAIQRPDSLYWNGSAWASGITWNDATGTTAWSYPLGAANLTDGSYVVQSRAIDNASNTQTTPDSKSFSYDNTAPTSTITFPVDGAFYNNATYRDGCTAGTYEVCGTATDPGTGTSGLSGVQVAIQRSSDSKYWNGGAYWNGGEWVSEIVWNNATGTANWSYSFLVSSSPYYYSLETGVSYTVQSRAIDNLGTVQIASDTNSFGFDNNEPYAQVTHPLTGPSIFNNATYTSGCTPGTDEICGTASDFGSSVARVQLNIRRGSDSLYWDGSAWVSGLVWLDTTGTTSWSYPLSATNLLDGQYFVQPRAFDQAGLSNTVPNSSSFIYTTTLRRRRRSRSLPRAHSTTPRRTGPAARPAPTRCAASRQIRRPGGARW